MDTRSSLPAPQGAAATGHGHSLSATPELAVNRLHASFTVKGSGTVKALSSLPAGSPVTLHFLGSPTFVHSAKLLCPNAMNVTFDAGDTAIMRSIGNGRWRLISRLSARSAVQFKTKFVFDGDSLSDVALYGTWPSLLPTISAFFAAGDYYYYATSGDKAADMATQFLTQGALSAPPTGGLGYYFLSAGTNDLAIDTAATIYNNLKAAWALARAAGYKVVASTIPRISGVSGTPMTVRAQLNALIIGDPSLYDFLQRPELWLPNALDTTAFLDGLHLTPAGNLVRAQHVARLILGLDNGLSVLSSGNDNLIVNPAMDVSQINGTTSIAPAGPTVDSFLVYKNGTMVIAAQQVADAPRGFSQSLKITVSTAQPSLGSADVVFIQAPVEGMRTKVLNWGNEAALPLSIGFWVKAHRPGAYSASVQNQDANRSYPFSFTVTTADFWEYKQVFGIPGEETGTWRAGTTARGLVLNVLMAGGSSYLSTANTWATSNLFGVTGSTNGVAATSDTFQITGVIARPGIYLPDAGQSPKLMRPIDQELALCRRYIRTVNIARGIAGSTTVIRASIEHPGMRDLPAPSLAGPATWTDVASSNPVQSSANISVNSQNADGGQYDLGNFPGLTQGRSYEAIQHGPMIILYAGL